MSCMLSYYRLCGIIPTGRGINAKQFVLLRFFFVLSLKVGFLFLTHIVNECKRKSLHLPGFIWVENDLRYFSQDHLTLLERLPSMATMKPTPHASFSSCGSYRPSCLGPSHGSRCALAAVPVACCSWAMAWRVRNNECARALSV